MSVSDAPMGAHGSRRTLQGETGPVRPEENGATVSSVGMAALRGDSPPRSCASFLPRASKAPLYPDVRAPMPQSAPL
eukprot:4579402-Pyramimonas_sp.AAC.1